MPTCPRAPAAGAGKVIERTPGADTTIGAPHVLARSRETARTTLSPETHVAYRLSSPSMTICRLPLRPLLGGASLTGNHSYVAPSSWLTATYAPAEQLMGW